MSNNGALWVESFRAWLFCEIKKKQKPLNWSLVRCRNIDTVCALPSYLFGVGIFILVSHTFIYNINGSAENTSHSQLTYSMTQHFPRVLI